MHMSTQSPDNFPKSLPISPKPRLMKPCFTHMRKSVSIGCFKFLGYLKGTVKEADCLWGTFFSNIDTCSLGEHKGQSSQRKPGKDVQTETALLTDRSQSNSFLPVLEEKNNNHHHHQTKNTCHGATPETPLPVLLQKRKVTQNP